MWNRAQSTMYNVEQNLIKALCGVEQSPVKAIYDVELNPVKCIHRVSKQRPVYYHWCFL